MSILFSRERKCLNPIPPLRALGEEPRPVESRQARAGVPSLYTKSAIREREEHEKQLSLLGINPGDDDFDIMKPPMPRPPLVGHVTNYNSAPSRLVTKFDIKKKLKFTEKVRTEAHFAHY